MEARTPQEILAYTSDMGIAKTQRKIPAVMILSFFAGAFIALAAYGSGMASFNLLSNPETYGLGRLVTGAVFPVGLMLVILAGAELFTGNNLIIVSVLDRKVRARRMFLNWALVYFGNLLGAVFVAWMAYQAGLFSAGNGLLGGMTVKIAAGKTSFAFFPAFLLGVMCNWLVCLAVWVSWGAKDIPGKVLPVFFIIGLFVISGFEHSVANMYYIPAGIFAKQNSQWVEMSQVSADQLAGLNWVTFFTKNLIPVTIGNIVGGTGLVGILYWLALRKKG